MTQKCFLCFVGRDQQRPHRKRLRHAHNRVVDGRIAMRMVFADDVTDDAGRLFVRLVVVVTELAHGEKYAPVYGF